MQHTAGVLGVVMDPIATIKPVKDSTLAMLLAAQRAGFELQYMELGDLSMVRGEAMARRRHLRVWDDSQRWFEFGDEVSGPLSGLDVILMRKDPPFDMEYVYATYILERAEHAGVLVVNKPGSLRDVNEKAYTAWFPELCPNTVISRSIPAFRQFLEENNKIVMKPLDGMGGASIFVVSQEDRNRNVIFETLTDHGRRFAMGQEFLPEISAGDKRILLVDGEVVPYCLARIPGKDDARGNLAAGGTGRPQPLSARDLEICATVGPALSQKGLMFVGVDVIGDYITEINVTSPTCIRELDSAYDLDIAGQLMQAILRRLRPITKQTP